MKRTAAAFAVTVLAAFLISSCKEDTIINSHAVPDVDNINTFQLPDTLTITARTVYDDTVITSYNNAGAVYHGLGSVTTDPFFGKTYSSIFFQVVPPTTSFAFTGNSPQIDSAVLVLPFSGFIWGDTTMPPGQKVRVFPITDPNFLSDTVFYSKQRVAVDHSKLLGQQTMYARSLRDSMSVWGVAAPSHLRIPLDTTVFMPLLRQGIDSSIDFPSFLRTFPGFCVEPDSIQVASAIPYFLLNLGTGLYDQAGVVVYYHNETDDSLATGFYFNTSYCAHYNFVKRDYSASPAYNLMFGTGPAAANANILLVQNEPGAAIDLHIPYAKSLPAGAIINKAQLILLQIDTISSNLYSAPSRLYPIGIDSTGASYSIADRYPLDSDDPLSFIDGTIKTVTIGGVAVNQYTINLPMELQQAVRAQKKDLHLRINGTQTFPAAYRLIAGGRSHGNWKLKFNVIYSKP